VPVTSYLILTNYKTRSKRKLPKPKDNINPLPTLVDNNHWTSKSDNQYLSTTTTRLLSWTISIRQITVLLDDSPIKETLRKVPRTIQDNCPAQSTILHTLPSGHHEGHPFCIPCLYARTSHIQHLPVALRTSASTGNYQRRTRIRDLQDSQLQD